MSELAFDEDGQHFQVPASVERWRTRRFNNPGRPGGAQVVYGEDGTPLFLDIETTAEGFREAVCGVPGRYRLDGVDAQGRPVEGVPPAYLMINGAVGASVGASTGAGAAPPPMGTALEYAVVELARANRDAITSMSERFSGVCEALADVVRAVDGAGLPRRAPLGPLLVDQVDGDDDDDDGERNAAPAPPQPTMATMLAQVMQMVQVFTQMGNPSNPAKFGAVMGQVVETAKVVEAVTSSPSEPTDAPPAPPERDERDERDDDNAPAVTERRARAVSAIVTHGAQVAPRAAKVRASAPGAPSPGGSSPTGGGGMPATTSATAGPAADPMAQFNQIMAALTPEEQAQVQYVMTTLSVRDLMQWYEQLARMSVAEGVAKIRAELAQVSSGKEQAA
jgi:hypothetical protein